MKIIDSLNQRSEAWLVYRKEGLGSSDIASIMGLNPYRNALAIYNEKHSFVGINHTNKAMQRGINFEDEARAKVCSILGVKLTAPCVQSMERPWMRASLDGYNAEENILVEIKTPTEKNYVIQSMIMQDMHYCQIQWQLLITSAKLGYLYVYSPEKKEGSLRVVEPDYEYQANLLKVAADFWYNNVLKGVCPSCEIEDVIIVDDIAAIELAEELELILESEKRKEARKEEIKQLLKTYGDGGSFRVSNITVKLTTGRKSLDKEAMIKDGIDITKYEKKGVDYFTFGISK